MIDYPLVSIIIVTWNGGEVFRNCLDSLYKINYPNWELIVVDNFSNNGTAELPLSSICKTKKVKLIKNKSNVGFAPANNQGYEISSGKYLLLLNNDTVVKPDLLNVLVKKMEKENDLAVVQPKIKIMVNPEYLDNAGSFITNIGFFRHWGFMQKDTGEFDKEREILTAKGACMLIRKSLIDKIGFFDSDFMSYFEESDFCWRVWLSGNRVVYYPKTFILHKVGFTIKRLGAGGLNQHYYKNRICSLIKNLGLKKLIRILPLHLIISVGISLTLIIRGQFVSSMLIWKAIWWNVINLKRTLIKRKFIQTIRVVSDCYVFDNLSMPVDWKAFFGDFKRIEEDLKK